MTITLHLSPTVLVLVGAVFLVLILAARRRRRR